MSSLDPARLVRLRRLTSVAASPSGTWLAVAASRLDEDGARFVSDIWRVPLSGGEPVQLTRGDNDDKAPAFRGDGALLFLSRRKAGKEDEARDQVWMLPADGGEARPLTDEPLGVLSFKVARSGRLLVLAAVLPGVPHESQRARDEEIKKRGPSALHYRTSPVRHWDAWLSPAAPHLVIWEDGARRDLTPEADLAFRVDPDWDLSADGKVAVITSGRLGPDRIPETDLLWLDLERGTTRTLPAGPRTELLAPKLSAAGERVACARHRRGEELHGKEALWIVDASSGEGRELAPSWDRWARPAFFSTDGRQVVVLADDEGDHPVFSVAVENGEVSRLTAGPGAHEAVVPLGEGALAGLRSRFLHPPEPFRCARAAGSAPEIVARLSGLGEEEAAALATVERHEARESDGTRVPYFLVRPKGNPQAPTALWIHGGPRTQFTDGWHWRWNALTFAAAGFAVALANPRGSTGFGQAHIEGLFPNRWGDTTYRDVMAVADALVAGGADPGRMAAMGGSFGGYMTNWIGGNTDRFRCLITHASVYDMSAFQGVTDWPGWWTYEMGGTPWDDPERFDRYSPHRRVTSWKSPALVIHGEKDYRVPVSEGLALFEALQHHGVPSELLVFPDENHFITKPRNIVVWYEVVQAFLHRHLR